VTQWTCRFPCQIGRPGISARRLRLICSNSTLTDDPKRWRNCPPRCLRVRAIESQFSKHIARLDSTSWVFNYKIRNVLATMNQREKKQRSSLSRLDPSFPKMSAMFWCYARPVVFCVLIGRFATCFLMYRVIIVVNFKRSWSGNRRTFEVNAILEDYHAWQPVSIIDRTWLYCKLL
jgi:hypothetical protein